MINLKNLNPNKINIDENSFKNTLIYNIVYVTINDLRHVKINSVNPWYLVIDKINGYTLKKAMEINEINIWSYFLMMKAKK